MTSLREIIAAYRWPLALVVVCVVLVLGGLEMFRALTPGAFRKANVTERFVSSFPEVSRKAGGRLELATVRATETFTRADEQFVAWGWLSLGETITEIRVPVTYRYHLDLDGKWDVQVTGNVCRVVAPPIRPSLPPAIHLSALERRTMRGWGRFDTSVQMDKLERDIEPRLETRAGDYTRFADVREACRTTAREFVEQWLLRNMEWRADPFHIVDVRFPDETQLAEKQ